MAALGVWIAAGGARRERDAERVAAEPAAALEPPSEDVWSVALVALTEEDAAGRRPVDSSEASESPEPQVPRATLEPGSPEQSQTAGELLCTVLDANDRPASDAAVLVSNRGSWTFTRIECCTDSAGLLRAPGEMEGRRVLALHPRSLPSGSQLLLADGDSAWKPTLRLRNGVPATVRCRVVRAGVPVPGAAITLRNVQRGEPRILALSTGDDGVLELFGLWPAEYELVARAPGVGVGSLALELEAGVIKNAEIDLAPGVDLHGVVVDAAGVGVAGAEVIVRQEHAGELLERTESGPEGAFSFSTLHPGRAELRAWAGSGNEATAILELDPRAETPVRPRLVLGLQISGRVQDPAGKPLAGIPVGVPHSHPRLWEEWSCADSTDDEGRFFLSPVPSGIVPIEVRRPSGIAARWGPIVHRTEVAAGSQGVVLTVDLERALSSGLRGRLAFDGMPYDGGYTLAAHEADKFPRSAFSLGPFEPEFVVEQLGAGAHTLSICGEDTAPYEVDIELAPGEVLDLGTIALQPCGTLVCEIRGAHDGAPMRAEARRVGSDDFERGIAVESGRGVAERLTPGSYEVTLYVGSTAVDRQTVEVPARGRGEVWLSAR